MLFGLQLSLLISALISGTHSRMSIDIYSDYGCKNYVRTTVFDVDDQCFVPGAGTGYKITECDSRFGPQLYAGTVCGDPRPVELDLNRCYAAVAENNSLDCATGA